MTAVESTIKWWKDRLPDLEAKQAEAAKQVQHRNAAREYRRKAKAWSDSAEAAWEAWAAKSTRELSRLTADVEQAQAKIKEYSARL